MATLGGRCVEVLIFNAAHVAAVHSIGVLSAERGNIEAVGALSHLFVGGEADAHFTVGHIAGQKPLHRRHNLGYTGLVVGAQQGGAVGGDERLTLQIGQEREFFHRQHRITAQNHVAAVVVLMKNGVDVLAGGIGGRIHMGNQTQGGLILTTGCGGDGAVNIAVFIYAGVGNAHLVQFLHQQLRQVQLAGRGGERLALGIRGSVNFGVADQSFVCSHIPNGSFPVKSGPSGPIGLRYNRNRTLSRPPPSGQGIG